MIDAMPRQRPPHLNRELSRHGKPVWYVRVGRGPRVRIRAEYGSEAFRLEYEAAIAGETPARVTIPVLPELAATLEAGPVGELTFICGADRKPLRKEVVGNIFRDACRAAGIRKSAHGLRKAAATQAANRGATVAQLEAIFGWEGGRMASLYTRSADRQRLAAEAIGKLSRTSTPAPRGRVRGKIPK